MKLLWTSLLVVSLCIATLPSGIARPANVTLPYQGATPFGAGAIDDECSARASLRIGIVCLHVPAGVDTMSFEVKDATRMSVGGSYYVFDAQEELVAMGAHCGFADSPVASGGLVIVRLELVNGPLHCASEGLAGGEATRGHVAFRLR